MIRLEIWLNMNVRKCDVKLNHEALSQVKQAVETNCPEAEVLITNYYCDGSVEIWIGDTYAVISAEEILPLVKVLRALTSDRITKLMEISI